MQVSGNWLGTVANFKFENLIAKEKNNGTTIAGNLTMKGLPNIDKTIIGFNNGSIKTNYKDLRKVILDKKKSTPTDDFFVTIKPDKDASFKNVVDVLDEMTINDVKRYSMIDATPMEYDFVTRTEQASGIQ